MNTILLQPTDTLFFRDGRPMTGSMSGHGAAWPLPNVVSAAFHAALHRAGLDADGTHKVHSHQRGSRGFYADGAIRDRKFGALVTAGPFPVNTPGTWFFPRPLDLQDASLDPGLAPCLATAGGQSSRAHPLVYSVANRLPPAKDPGINPWLAQAAYQEYLQGSARILNPDDSISDASFSSTEQTIGIAIDPASGTAGQGDAAGQIYSAHYLRLRDGWRLGVCATAPDKEYSHAEHGNDLVKALLNGGRHQIIIGGQQRVCTAEAAALAGLPLPLGKINGFHHHDGKWLVKWALLSPAVWPAIQADPTRGIRAHAGGWLPNWIDPESGTVLLKAVADTKPANVGRARWRQQVRAQQSIAARLVAAVVPRPSVISGWALPDNATNEAGGAQSTHLAVPAGAVYYFDAASEAEASNLASALNWHGADLRPTTIKNRRSTLLGEKGFGLGVCGTWQFYENLGPRTRNHPASHVPGRL